MQSNKGKKSFIYVYTILAFVFVLLTLIIPFRKTAASWVMLAFSLVSIVAGCAISLYAFCSSKDLKSKYYGYPLFRIGFFYTMLQLLLTVAIYIIGAYVNLEYWIGVVISVLLGGIVAIGLVTGDSVSQYIKHTDENTLVATKAIKRFNVDIAGLLDICKNQEVYPTLKKLVERFKYSDPVSSEATRELESQIKTEIESLKSIINTAETAILLEKIESISNLLSTRNRVCESEK